MKFGIVGLGRMGANLARNARDHGHVPVGFDANWAIREALRGEGVRMASTLAELTGLLPTPRVVLVYVPAGEPTEGVVRELGDLLQRGDVLADGGNSHWEDSKRRQHALADRGITFLDCGTSGGVEGARHGACFMVGGERTGYDLIAGLLTDLAVPHGCLHVGAPGAGHFVKLIHNMIEFGMVQAIGEGVELLARSDYPLDLPALFRLWDHGSIIRGLLIELMERGLRRHPDLADVSPYTEDTGEQNWGVEYALRRNIPIPLLAQAAWGFFESRDSDRLWARSVAVLRNEYGGHPIHPPGAQP